MNIAVLEKPEPDTVSQHAKDALERSSGDVAKAAKLLEEDVRKNRALRQALLEPLIQYACHQAVGLESRRSRDRIWSPANLSRQNITPEQRARALAESNLLLFPLPGGLRLGNAKRADIEEASEFYGKQSVDMAHKARWLRLIAQSLPDGAVASSVLSDERLRELQEEAKAHE